VNVRTKLKSIVLPVSELIGVPKTGAVPGYADTRGGRMGGREWHRSKEC